MVESLITPTALMNIGAPAALVSASTYISPALSFITPALSVASAVGQVSAGYQANTVAQTQARQLEISARQEEVRGRQEADKIRRALNATLASQRAAFAARGINPNTGTPLVLATESRSAAAQDIQDAQFNAQSAATQKRLEGVQSRIQGGAAKTAGYTSAAGTLYQARDIFGSLVR